MARDKTRTLYVWAYQLVGPECTPDFTHAVRFRVHDCRKREKTIPRFDESVEQVKSESRAVWRFDVRSYPTDGWILEREIRMADATNEMNSPSVDFFEGPRFMRWGHKNSIWSGLAMFLNLQ